MLWIILGIIIGILLITILILWLIGERWCLLRPSTWQILRANGLRRVLNFSAIHGYIYGLWTIKYLDILMNHIYPRLGKRGKKWLSNCYHAKILTQENAESIIMLKAGAHPKVVSERLGHATVAFTLDTYTHVVPGLQEVAAKTFDKFLNTQHQIYSD